MVEFRHKNLQAMKKFSLKEEACNALILLLEMPDDDPFLFDKQEYDERISPKRIVRQREICLFKKTGNILLFKRGATRFLY